MAVERMERLRAVVERTSRLGNEARIGRIEEVLVEGPSRTRPVPAHRPHPSEPAGALPVARAVLRPGTYAEVRSPGRPPPTCVGELVEVLDAPSHRTRIPVSAG